MSSKRKQKAAAQMQMQQQATAEPEEPVYQAPDPNTKITVPMQFAGKLDDSKFIIIWPNYLNSNKTIFQGRRIAKDASCIDPIVAEMSEVCQVLKLRHVIEPYKCYPRDFTYSGRIKVELKGEDGEFANPEVSSRKSLMLKIGEMIPKLKIRQQRIAHEKAQRQAIEAQQQAKAASAGTNAKKSGKKKGKR